MSIEQAIQNLADAINGQTEFAKSQAGKGTTAPKAAGKPAPVKAAETTEGDDADAGEAPAPSTKKSEASTAKATSAPKAASAKPAPAADVIDPAYAPVKAAILSAIAGGHRTAVTALLKKHGAKTGQDLTPDVYDEVLGDLDAIVNPDDGELA